ncbi:M43 family zinc metalloprotease [Niabella hibiscisoli]|uniref:M43 family zinc metalloprotease n=1 Tax=Niabella hibiscisoli TaxID=1825928 RepID=UPI001F0F00FE|nr:M43 family zinc metalloprotease [Niabella hibiscisoli]MCH5716078.1 GEVED domain-containing protein [Niabella hibiscisoli]
MRTFRFFLLISSVFISTISFSQQAVCGFDFVNQHLRKNPDYVQQLAATEYKIQQDVDRIVRTRAQFQNLNVLPGPAYEIPVVVHVIAPSNNPAGWVNPTDQQIIDAIDRLSADFAATSTRSVGASTPIKFTLAKRTLNCSPSDGIVRVNGGNVPGYNDNGVVVPNSPATVDGADNDAIRSLSFWPNNQVYNIWVVWKIAAEGPVGTFVAGYANLPLENEGFQNMPSHWMEGMMIIASQLVSPTSTTLTHELGHAFGLYHTFEGGSQTDCSPMTDGTNCSTIGDKVCDTDPIKNLLQGGACAILNTDPNSCYNNSPYNGIQKNIMGYGGCLDRFTAGQSTRMMAALNVARGGLMTSVASTPPPVTAVKANATQAPASNSDGSITSIGPRNVTLGNLTYQSYGYNDDNQQFYQDHSCNLGTTLAATTGQQLTVTTGGVNRQTCKVWIDFNNNGVFDSDELILESNTPAGTGVFSHSVEIPVAKLTAAGTARNELLRMRVRADFINNSNFGPGGALLVGQTEDFWVSIDGALPVVFNGVAARIKNDQLFVDWKTASETNNDHFFVEASFDGENFARIAKVDTKAVNGISASSLSYNISIDNKGTVVSLGAALIAALSLFSFKRNRKWMLLTAVVAAGIFVACQKRDHAGANSNDNHVKYIRIAQVDKDGTIQFSRSVSVISE